MSKQATECKLWNTSTINTGIKISKSKSIEQTHECNFNLHLDDVANIGNHDLG